MQPSEEIKAKLDVVDLIGEYLQLRPAGSNFKANCPFHRENSPSFMVSPERQIWHCFGCGKGGDIFSFVMEMEGLEFIEALRLLANKAGVVLKSNDPKNSSKKSRLWEMMDWARRFYVKKLSEAPAAPALDYLLKRGLREETIEDWQIGYSSDSWDDLINFLRARGYRDQEMVLAGLAMQKSGTNRIYNRFRERIMFPINDANSQTVGFSARIRPGNEDKDKMGKYVNSPQTPIYDKSALLFGLDRAKTEIKAKDLAVIVEGQMDVVSAHQAGFKNTVAQSGTALTPAQIKLLSRYTKNLAFALDADEAGQSAIARGEDVIYRNSRTEITGTDRFGWPRRYLDPLLSQDLNVKVIEIPEGKDPDDCIRNNPELWRQAVSQAKPIMRHHFDYVFKNFSAAKVEDRRRAAQQLLPKIARLANRIEFDFWLRELAEKIQVEEDVLRETIKNQKDQKNSTTQSAPIVGKTAAPVTPSTREERQSELFLALILRFFEFLGAFSADFKSEALSGEDNQEFYKNILIYYNEISANLDGRENFANVSFDHNNFRVWQSAREPRPKVDAQLKKLDVLLLLGDEYFSNWPKIDAAKEARRLMVALKKAELQRRRRRLELELTQAENRNDSAAADNVLAEIKRLSDEIKQS